MNVTIFSKDRACQLDLLLRSIRDLTNIGTISIIYTHSNDRYKEAYGVLMHGNTDCMFIKENDFKNQLIMTILPSKEYTMFLTDDAVFKSRFDVNDIYLNVDTACISLMLGNNINWAYEEERPVRQPDSLSWNWKGADIDFNYPMSVIGHIWRTSDISDKINNLDYNQAWNVESALKDHPIEKPLMECYDESKVVHIANNVVSPMGNKSGEQSVKELNDRFLKGEQIKWECIQNNSVHFEWEYKFERMAK